MALGAWGRGTIENMTVCPSGALAAWPTLLRRLRRNSGQMTLGLPRSTSPTLAQYPFLEARQAEAA